MLHSIGVGVHVYVIACSTFIEYVDFYEGFMDI